MGRYRRADAGLGLAQPSPAVGLGEVFAKGTFPFLGWAALRDAARRSEPHVKERLRPVIQRPRRYDSRYDSDDGRYNGYK